MSCSSSQPLDGLPTLRPANRLQLRRGLSVWESQARALDAAIHQRHGVGLPRPLEQEQEALFLGRGRGQVLPLEQERQSQGSDSVPGLDRHHQGQQKNRRQDRR